MTRTSIAKESPYLEKFVRGFVVAGLRRQSLAIPPNAPQPKSRQATRREKRDSPAEAKMRGGILHSAGLIAYIPRVETRHFRILSGNRLVKLALGIREDEGSFYEISGRERLALRAFRAIVSGVELLPSPLHRLHLQHKKRTELIEGFLECWLCLAPLSFASTRSSSMAFWTHRWSSYDSTQTRRD